MKVENQNPSCKYKLYGVLIHEGIAMNGGHYYSYIKGPNNCWYIADDDHVNLSSGDQPLRQEAYVLFYIREDLPSSSQPTPTEPQPTNSTPEPNLPNSPETPSATSTTNGIHTNGESFTPNGRKRKLVIHFNDQTASKFVKTMNGTKFSPVVKNLQSAGTWTFEDKNEQFKFEIEKSTQQNINRTNEERLESLKINPKDSHDKELDKGRTKKVRVKKSWSAGPNYFQRVSDQMRENSQ